ncbi:MAG: hypothetical protein JNM17_17575 [Archangium sp.]|nr:hypothetical protein [Archangium sp.]
MENREPILAAARSAYEWGRFWSGTRVAVALAPLVALAGVMTANVGACACLGGVLVTVSVFLRWRDRRGVQAVEAGIRAGLIPLVIGVMLRVCSADCTSPTVLPICVLGGLGAGWLLGSRLGALKVERSTWAWSAVVAALTASLGCVGFAAGGVIGVMAALVGGTLVVRALAR